MQAVHPTVLDRVVLADRNLEVIGVPELGPPDDFEAVRGWIGVRGKERFWSVGVSTAPGSKHLPGSRLTGVHAGERYFNSQLPNAESGTHSPFGQ